MVACRRHRDRHISEHHPKRGVAGFTAADILPNYRGTLVHDFGGLYDTLLDCQHSRCNAHLLRELKACVESGHQWAESIIYYLLEMKQAAAQARHNEQARVAATQRKRLKSEYDIWAFAGLKAHPEQLRLTGQRGRIKPSTETNLLRRLRDKREEVFRFLEDLQVPFDNNQAERDLRMVKVQQKVSGCFRSQAGAERFCTISSYIATIRKRGLNLMAFIKVAFTGDPLACSA